MDINFVNSEVGFVLGFFELESKIWKTIDGGAAWNNMNAPDGGFYKIQFSNNFGYAVASIGKIVKSSDGGNNWIEQPTVTDNGLYALYFNTYKYVFAGRLLGTILKTIPTELLLTNTGKSINEVSIDFFLSQNYPNPFNPYTVIRYSLSENRFTTLKIYDALGKEIETLVNEKQNPGTYSVDWIASNFPSGVYFYKLQIENYSETKRMVLLK